MRATRMAFTAALSLPLALVTPLRAQGTTAARGPWPAASAESCAALSGDAAALLSRAWRAAGIDGASQSVAAAPRKKALPR